MADSFTLRPLQLADSQILLEGRNCGLVHPFLFSDHLIATDEHHRWIEKRLANPDMPVYVFLHHGKPIGAANLTHLDSEHRRGEWGFYIWDESAPKGAATAMLAAFLDELFLRRNLRKLCAQVLCANTRSLHLHRKLGFSQEGLLRRHVIRDGNEHDVISFALFDRQWDVARTGFAGKLSEVNTLTP